MRSFSQTTGILPHRVAAVIAAAALVTMAAAFLHLTAPSDARTERPVLPEKTQSLILLPQPRH